MANYTYDLTSCRFSHSHFKIRSVRSFSKMREGREKLYKMWKIIPETE